MTNSRPRLLVLGAVTFVVVSAGLLGPANVARSGSGTVDAVERQAETTTTPPETTPDFADEPVLRICERTIEGEASHVLTSERYVPFLQQRGWTCSRLSPVLVAGLEDENVTTPEMAETPTASAELARVSLLRVCERRIEGETVLIASPEEDLSLLRSQGWSCGLHLPVLVSGLEEVTTPVETPGNETEATTTE